MRLDIRWTLQRFRARPFASECVFEVEFEPATGMASTSVDLGH
jgi:hypothetical protein